MNQDYQAITLSESLANKNIHSFSHLAMATVFEIFISGSDYDYAQQACQAAFAEVDRLEQELSRFIENSDIARINVMSKNDTIVVGYDAFQCLLNCFELRKSTLGAFDIAIGKAINDYKNKSTQRKEIVLSEETLLQADPEKFQVTLVSDNVNLDLGGYGKGYAVDAIYNLLVEWGIKSAFIHSGSSTAFAFGSKSDEKDWDVTLTHPANKSVLCKTKLANMALSGSGITKGDHIINPLTGQPVKKRKAAWVYAQTAAVSDALSTAFMILPSEEINEYCRKHESISAMVLGEENGAEPVFFGKQFV